MASAIDPTKPQDGLPAVKADLRANLAAAKTEIEALQGHDHAGEVLAGVELQDVREALQTPPVAGGVLTVDLALGNVADVVLDANVTNLMLLNPPPAGKVASVTLLLKQDATGGRTLAWPTTVRWPGAVAPVLSAGPGDLDLYTLLTSDGGATWLGMTGGQDFA